MTNREITLPFKDIGSLINNTKYVLLVFRGTCLDFIKVNVEDYLYVYFFLLIKCSKIIVSQRFIFCTKVMAKFPSVI